MTSPILGLHHVTATVNDAQADLDFCAGALGLRLVKKTVNFDNHHVFHFYYGNERGLPGTLWTTFPYKGHGVRVGTHGAGQIATTSFSVPAGSIEWWRSRLSARGVAVRDVPARFGDAAIACKDSSGLEFELVGAAGDERAPWTASGVGPDSRRARAAQRDDGRAIAGAHARARHRAARIHEGERDGRPHSRRDWRRCARPCD